MLKLGGILLYEATWVSTHFSLLGTDCVCGHRFWLKALGKVSNRVFSYRSFRTSLKTISYKTKLMPTTKFQPIFTFMSKFNQTLKISLLCVLLSCLQLVQHIQMTYLSAVYGLNTLYHRLPTTAHVYPKQQPCACTQCCSIFFFILLLLCLLCCSSGYGTLHIRRVVQRLRLAGPHFAYEIAKNLLCQLCDSGCLYAYAPACLPSWQMFALRIKFS